MAVVTREAFDLWAWAGRGARAPLGLWIPGAAVAALAVLPLAYLVLRTASAGAAALELATSARTLQLLLQTAALAAVVTTGCGLLGVALAWLTVRTDLPAARIWSVVLVLPLVVPTYVGAFTYIAAMGPRGILQQLLEALFGVQRLPEFYGFWGAALVLTVFSYPYVLLSVQGVFARFDPRFEQASRSLGFGPWATFVGVTLPLLRPAIASGALLVALYTLSDFGAVSLLQFDSLTRAIYLQYQGSFDRTMAAVLALLLVLLTAAVLVVEAAMRGRARYYHAGAGSPEPAPRVPLGALRWPVVGLCSMVAFLGVGLPMAILGYWLFRGVMAGVSFAPIWAAVGSSALASGLAAATTVLASLPIAVLAVRHGGLVTALIERAAYSAFSLPGIVVALSLIFFAANYAPWLYQTLPLLVLAYGVRFLPEALGPVRSALLQVSPRVEEVARVLGRRPLEVLATITVPLVWPGALAGAALVFLSVMKELPVTLLLSPIGFKTLAIATWGAASEGFFAQAALPALLLVLVSAGSLFAIVGDAALGHSEPARE